MSTCRFCLGRLCDNYYNLGWSVARPEVFLGGGVRSGGLKRSPLRSREHSATSVVRGGPLSARYFFIGSVQISCAALEESGEVETPRGVNGATTLSRVNLSGYVGYVTILSCMFTIVCCLVIRLRLRLG